MDKIDVVKDHKANKFISPKGYYVRKTCEKYKYSRYLSEHYKLR